MMAGQADREEGPVVQGVEDHGRKRMPSCNGTDRAAAIAVEIPNLKGCRLPVSWNVRQKQKPPRVDQVCVKGRCGCEHD